MTATVATLIGNASGYKVRGEKEIKDILKTNTLVTMSKNCNI